MICKQKNLVKVLLLAVVVSLFTMTTAFAQEYPTQNMSNHRVFSPNVDARTYVAMLPKKQRMHPTGASVAF